MIDAIRKAKKLSAKTGETTYVIRYREDYGPAMYDACTEEDRFGYWLGVRDEDIVFCSDDAITKATE